MFRELTRELLDLRVLEKGYRGALYAYKLGSGGGGSCGCSSACCCFCISC